MFLCVLVHTVDIKSTLTLCRFLYSFDMHYPIDDENLLSQGLTVGSNTYDCVFIWFSFLSVRRFIRSFLSDTATATMQHLLVAATTACTRSDPSCAYPAPTCHSITALEVWIMSHSSYHSRSSSYRPIEEYPIFVTNLFLCSLAECLQSLSL